MAHAPVHRHDDQAVQAQVRRLRLRLLGGRGPGASAAEIAEHTRDRATLGGEPVAEQRERVARQAAAARRAGG